jgi:hypothetical protein
MVIRSNVHFPTSCPNFICLIILSTYYFLWYIFHRNLLVTYLHFPLHFARTFFTSVFHHILACYGVFCKRRLQLHTLFGPLQGVARDHAPEKSSGTANNTLILAEMNGVSIKDLQDKEQQHDTRQLIWPFTDTTNQLKFLDTSDLGKIKDMYCI